MIDPISDFYCKPQSEAEAKEIVARAVAHGAEPVDFVATMEINGIYEFTWDCYRYWGSYGCATFGGENTFINSKGEQLTIDQLRERAPFVGDLSDYEIKVASENEYDPIFAITHDRWESCRRALHFAGILNGDKEKLAKDKLEEFKDAFDSCRMVHEEVARQATANIEAYIEKFSKEKSNQTDINLGDSIRKAWRAAVSSDGQKEAPKGNESPRPHKQANDFLNAALGHMQDRAATYDAPGGERSMGKTVAAFNALYGTELTEEQGWAFMCLLKLVRTSQGAFRADNYEDLAAYAGLMGESASKGE